MTELVYILIALVVVIAAVLLYTNYLTNKKGKSETEKLYQERMNKLYEEKHNTEKQRAEKQKQAAAEAEELQKIRDKDKADKARLLAFRNKKCPEFELRCVAGIQDKRIYTIVDKQTKERAFTQTGKRNFEYIY